MPRFQVKKVVAVCLLEAVKGALDQLGAHRMELAQRAVPSPTDLTRAYGDVRRMRDYLQRCAGGYGDSTELDLAVGDAAVIVACCRLAVAALDDRIAATTTSPMDRQGLHKKQALLAHHALEMAARPLLELPVPRGNRAGGEAARALAARLREKLFEPARVETSTAHARSVIAGVRSFGEEVQAMAPPPADPAREVATDRIPFAAPADDEPAGAPAAAAPAHPPRTDEVAALFESQRIGDPRLRALAGIDMRGYTRALAANDHRLATVLMASVLECAVLDHVIARRTDFGLAGTPDTWNIADLVLTALGEQARPKDRSLAFHVFAARNLLRPAVQLTTPTVVTAATFETLRDFVQRALHGLGYGARVDGELQAGSRDSIASTDPTC